MEKRRVQLLESYRDLIVVSNTEIEFKRKLDDLLQIFKQKYAEKPIWLGVTDASYSENPAGHCIWTDVGNDLAFGQYWFQVRRIAFQKNEVYIKLKCLREYNKEFKTDGVIKPEPWDLLQYDPATVAKSFTDLLEKWKTSLHDLILYFCSVWVTYDNFKSFARFFCLLFISLCVGAVQSIKFLSNFIIIFLYHLSNLIRVSTPLLLGIVDFFSKIFGGFYILIAMMWRDVVKRRPSRTLDPGQPKIRYGAEPKLWRQPRRQQIGYTYDHDSTRM